jgi:hypothetical protein
MNVKRHVATLVALALGVLFIWTYTFVGVLFGIVLVSVAAVSVVDGALRRTRSRRGPDAA